MPVDLMLVHRDMERVLRTIEGVELWLNFAKTCVAVIERDAVEGEASSYAKVLDAALDDSAKRLIKLRESLRGPTQEPTQSVYCKWGSYTAKPCHELAVDAGLCVPHLEKMKEHLEDNAQAERQANAVMRGREP